MKKQIAVLLFLSMFGFSGCASEGEASQTTEKTTAATIAENNGYYETIDDELVFEDYAAFLNEYTKGRSTNYVHPLPEIVNTWEMYEPISYYPNSHYALYYEDTANQVRIMLEIDYTTSYSEISQYVNKQNYTYGDSEILEMTDRYAVKCYLDDDSYAILGITGEQNIMYTLVVNSADENADTVALLKEYKDLLEL